MKLTPWFPPEVKPVHVGVYMSDDTPLGPWFRYWNGKQWGAAAKTIDKAMELETISFACQENKWRGLLRES